MSILAPGQEESSIAAEVERSLAVDSSAGLIHEEEAATDAEVASDAVPASVEAHALSMLC